MLKCWKYSRRYGVANRLFGSISTDNFNSQSIMPKWPSSSDQLTSVDRLFSVKPALDANDEKVENYYEGLPELDELGVQSILEPEGDPNVAFRLGKHILNLGKVHYRHEEAVSFDFKERKAKICSYRTVPQIRRCLKDWMIKSDREKLYHYRKRKLGWKIETVKEKGNRRDENENANRMAEKTPLIYGPEETVAYAHYYMPSRYAIAKRIMREISTLLPNYKPERVVDFGCGPGTVAAAICDTPAWFPNPSSHPNHKHAPQTHRADRVSNVGVMKKYVGIDISKSMIDAGKIMLEGRGVNSIFWTKTSEAISRAHTNGDRYDMAVASFTLSELVSDKNKIAATQLLYEMLDVGGLLVILENGNPRGSHIVRSARKLILDSFSPEGMSTAAVLNDDGSDIILNNVLDPPPGVASHKDIGAFTVAPCTHDKPCPLGDGVWCSFSQKVHSGMIRKAQEEKFSYVVIQKRALNQYDKQYPGGVDSKRKYGRGNPVSKSKSEPNAEKFSVDVWSQDRKVEASSNDPDEAVHPTPVEILNKFMHTPLKKIDSLVETLIDEVDWSEYSPPLYRSEYGRIIRAPLKHRGHVTMDICTPLGNVKRHILSKNHLLNIPSLYSAVRKTTWGGLHPITTTQGGRADGVYKSKVDGLVMEESSPLCKYIAEDDTFKSGYDRVISLNADEDDDDFVEEEFVMSSQNSRRMSPNVNRNKLKMLSPFAMSSLKTKKNKEALGTEKFGETMFESESNWNAASAEKGVSLSLQELMATGKLQEMLIDDDDEEVVEKKTKHVGRRRSNRTGAIAKRRK